jgi:hypothetical protein
MASDKVVSLTSRTADPKSLASAMFLSDRQEDFEEFKSMLAYELLDLRIRLVKEIGGKATAALLRIEASRALWVSGGTTGNLARLRMKMVSVGGGSWTAQQLRAESYAAERHDENGSLK